MVLVKVTCVHSVLVKVTWKLYIKYNACTSAGNFYILNIYYTTSEGNVDILYMVLVKMYIQYSVLVKVTYIQ